MPTIVVSTKDVVSKGVGEIIAREYAKESDKVFGNFPVYEGRDFDMIVIDTLHIYAQWLENEYPSDLYIFPSRHRSEKHTKTLSVHPTGNFGNAELGGLPMELSTAPALHMLKALRNLFLDGYSTTYEVTHHGPTLKTPLFFIEVGSSEEEWTDENAYKSIAKAIISSLHPDPAPVAIGIGAGHYAPDFTRLAMKEGIAFGHMASKYMAENINKEMFRKMVERTYPRPTFIKISSLPSEKKKEITSWAEEFGLEML